MEKKTNVLDFSEKSKHLKLIKEIERDLVCVKALVQDRLECGEQMYECEILTIIEFLEKRYTNL